MSTATLAEFQNKFQDINDKFIDSTLQSAVTGKTAKTGQYGITGLDNYSTFVSNNLPTSYSFPSSDTCGALHYISSGNTAYSSGSSPLTVSTPIELNFYSFSFVGGTSLGDYINNLQLAYGILGQFEQLLNGAVITVNQYNLVNNGPKVLPQTMQYKFNPVDGYIQYGTTATVAGVSTTTFTSIKSSTDTNGGILSIVNINTLLTNKSVLSNTDIFSLSRILLMQIMIINCYIGLFLYANSSATTGITTTDAGVILTATISVFENLNNNMYNNDTNGNGISSILSSLKDRITTFKATRDGITDANTTLKSNKMDLQGNIDRVTSQKTGSKGIRWYQYLALAVLVLVACSQGLVITSDLPDEHKMVYTAGIFAAAIISAFILYIIEVRYFAVPPEGFTSPTINDIYNGSDISNVSNISSNIGLFTDAILKLANAFLDNTLYIGLALQSYQAYGMADSSMQKELSYYNDQNSQIGNTSNKLRDTGNIIALNARDSYSRTMFFIELLVILSTTAFMFVMSSSLPILHPYILGLGVIALIVVMFIYILAINSKVRTDSSKVYWGKPSTVGL